MPGLRGPEGDVGKRDGEREDAVDEDEELRVLELPRVPGRVHVLECDMAKFKQFANNTG